MKWVGDISKTEHTRLHRVMRKKYGNAQKCENDNCKNKTPKRFEWALLKGRSYSDNPKDYLQLCCSCHRKYDFTEEIRSKLKGKKIGERHNRSKLTESQVLCIHKLIKSGIQNKDIAVRFNVDNSTISDIKRGKRWPHIYNLLTQKQ